MEKQETKCSFDQWWIVTSKRMVLKPHLKEIIWADFKARKLSEEETTEKYDAAMKLFGL